MADFSLISNFNPQANFKSVRIGADAPVLEVELNELQDIAEHRTKDLISTYFGDGLNGQQNFTYDPTTKNLHISGGRAIVNGNTVQITDLRVKADEGEQIYLKVWEQTVTYADPIHYLGNRQETRLVPNTILDERIGTETSQRIQVQYDLVTSIDTEADVEQEIKADYLHLGEIVNGAFVVLAPIKTDEERVLVERFISEGSQQIFVTEKCFVKGTNTLQVFVNGKFLMPELDYTELSHNAFQLNEMTNENDEVVVIYKRAVMSQQHKGHASKHSKQGSDPLDINQLRDEENLLGKLRMVSTSGLIIDGGSFNDPIIDEEIYDGGVF